MEGWLIDRLPLEYIEALLAAPFGEGWVALIFFAITASVYASGVPGTLLPLSFSSGALLGWTLGMAAVGGGVMIGSLVLYRLLKRGSQATLRDRYGGQMARLDALASRGGILSLIMLRLAGLPHLAVTAVCALASVGIRRYALATFIGVLPAVALSATAGAAL
ncbi:VTT domain-containing protein [Tsuneonella sp. HG249]